MLGNLHSIIMKTQVFAVAVLCLSTVWPLCASDPNRLDPTIRPITESLELYLNPAEDKFSGTARIELEFESATNSLRFHAKKIDLGRSTLDGVALKLLAGPMDLVTAESGGQITKGRHVLEIAFTNTLNVDGTAIYRTESGGARYIFTQMEPQEARRAFPCWDEPSFKIPWQITLVIPIEFVAVANMPIAQTISFGDKKRVEFGRTPPLPSYLVAFAVGKFESVNAAGQPAPGSVYMVAGQKRLGDLAAREAAPLLSELERYFGIPYPYPKLDHIAAPEFTFGAMENAGLITYRDTFLLFDEKSIDYEQKRLLAEGMAHEMSHMWFGDLVTMQWWDDLWLNESFATWMSYKVAGRVHPDMRFDIKSYQIIGVARAADTQPSVKAIRRTFNAGDNIMEAFDELSYNKGQAILRMAEGWLGEDNFRKALRIYFDKHRWGNARAEDLWAAIADSGERSLDEALRRFVELPGIPQIKFQRLGNDSIEVSQKRYRTIIGKSVAEQTWHVPIIVRYGGRDSELTGRLLLTNSSAVFKLPGLDKAEWLYPNAGESGYFTWNLAPDLTRALKNRAAIPLTPVERLGILNSVHLAVQSGEIGAEQMIGLLLEYANDSEPEILQQVVGTIGVLYGTYVTTDADRRAYAAILRKTLRPILDRLGFEAKPGGEPQWDPLRAQLIQILGIRGEDQDVIQFCRKTAEAQLAEPRSVNGMAADATLMVASWFGDGDWLARVRDAAGKATEPDLRARFLQSCVPFRDETVARQGLDYLLTDAVRPTDVVLAIMPAVARPESASIVFHWIVDRYGALKKKLPEDFMPMLPSLFGSADDALIDKARAFFLDPVRSTPFAEVEFRKVAEAVELRMALRKLHGQAVRRFLTTEAGSLQQQ